MTPPDVGAIEIGSTSELADQPFDASTMGDSMDSDLLPELLGETWVAATHLDEVTGDLPPSGSEPDLITSSLLNKTLIIVWEWVRAGSPPPWSDCGGLSPQLGLWHLQFGNLSVDLDGCLWRRHAPPAMAKQLVVPGISVTAPIRRSTPWSFIRKNFPFIPTIEMSTLFSFPSKNQLNGQGAIPENPGTSWRVLGGLFSVIRTPYLLDIWVFPRLFADYWIGYIGRDFVRMFDLILPAKI